ncbi:hypothetical protein [Nitrosomonas sp. Is37]|uniref:hypothetical protein n=1 Tax=Nitrosomonas sp. Is37 TaxID=3080535 RepID=UPI00294B43D0|nr:hypothetical protein [Nitrosomonas sp. Is37]MDV6344154.1 hypothetical protein [Nitrosomonas sp. Is37]
MTYRGIFEILPFTRMGGRYGVHRMTLQARIRRCSSLLETALRPHRALPRTWITTRSTPSNCNF